MGGSGRRALVVGGGAFGLTAALELRRRAWGVRLLEAGPIPAPRASSTDLSKIVRMDYGGDAVLTELAQVAVAGWRAWNLRWPRPLFHEVGFLLLRSSPPRPGDFEAESRRVLEARGVEVEPLDPEAVAARFPAWRADRWGYGHRSPRAGWVESGEVIRALARDARRAGVRIHEGTAVEALVEERGAVTGVTLADGSRLRGDAVVVAAGAWAAALVPDLEGVLRPTAQPLLHFRVPDAERWSPPAFLPWGADIAHTGWYGFPATRDGIVKVGHHGPGMAAVADSDHPVPDEHVHRCRGFLSHALPDLAGAPLLRRRSCLYCDTPDGRFWIDRHPGVEGLVVAAGGSGHAFKFTPVLGPLVADAVEGSPGRWGDPFRWREVEGAGGVEAARYTGE